MAHLPGAAAPFIDFPDVWLAYNDELLAQGSSRSRPSTCR
jgi:hypothetical protein